jgi:hypothetical protein
MEHRGHHHRPDRGGGEAMTMTDAQLRGKIRDLVALARR